MEASEFAVIQALNATRESKDLSDREKHLIGLAVTATRGCSVCTGSRIELALQAGIPYESVRAAIDLAAAVNAGVVLRTAIDGAEKYSIDQICSGPECSAGTP